MFDGLPSSIPHIRSGALRALAVADEAPNPKLPGVPTFVQSGFPGLISYSWFGVSGPKGLPRPIVEKLNTEIRAILKLPAVQQRYEQLTADAPDMTPDRFTEFVREELASWSEVVRATGAKPE